MTTIPQFCPYCGERLRSFEQPLSLLDEQTGTRYPYLSIQLDCQTPTCPAYGVTHDSRDYLVSLAYYVSHPPKTAKARG